MEYYCGGGPAGPEVIEPLELLVLDHVDPAGQHAVSSMEGMSCLEPLEQSILHSLWIAQPKECVIEEGSVWEPVLNPAISYALEVNLWRGTLT